MSCPESPSSLHENHGPEQADFLSHLRSCKSCRDRAAVEDPTLLFAALPPVDIESDEVETMREAVRGLRRVSHHLQPTSAVRVWRQWAALAAVVIAALILAPERQVAVPPATMPFSGALGIGPGALALDDGGYANGEAPAGLQQNARIEYRVIDADWRIEEITIDDRNALGLESARGRTAKILAEGAVKVPASGVVEEQIEGKFGLRFEMVPIAAGDRFALRGFELSQQVETGNKVLVAADLLLTTDESFLLKVQRTSAEERSLFVILQAMVGGPGES